jgi:ADP-ribosylglycohydrolase
MEDRNHRVADRGHDRRRGCLMLGAVGDALGAPVEFWSLAEIRRRLGPHGVTGFIGPEAQITDDTQMTLFTAEGLIRAEFGPRTGGTRNPAVSVLDAYQRWLCTQHVGFEPEPDGPFDGWLLAEPRLHHQRAPGRTCIAALAETWKEPRLRAANDSKGCGGVMRAAPVGLLAGSPDQAFALGCEIAALTHGHPSGYLPAGVLAAAVTLLVDDVPLPEALHRARRLLPDDDGHDPRIGETAAALDAAVALAATGPITPEAVERLGGGWVGEEALAIAVYCALAAPDPLAALLASVNHSGDSDSTGSICGNLLGAAHGTAAVPGALFDRLDLADVVLQMADDLWRQVSEAPGEAGDVPASWRTRYPGW